MRVPALQIPSVVLGPTAPGFLPLFPQQARRSSSRRLLQPHRTLPRNTSADRNRLRGNPVSRAHRNLFLMLSLLPPQPTPHPGSPGKHDQNENCSPLVWKRKCFLPTHIPLLKIDPPAAGLVISPALKETTSALLQALCTLGLVARGTPRSPHYCNQGWASAWNSWVAKKLWNSMFTPLEPHSLPIKASFKSDKFLFPVIHPWVF